MIKCIQCYIVQASYEYDRNYCGLCNGCVKDNRYEEGGIMLEPPPTDLVRSGVFIIGSKPSNETPDGVEQPLKVINPLDFGAVEYNPDTVTIDGKVEK